MIFSKLSCWSINMFFLQFFYYVKNLLSIIVRLFLVTRVNILLWRLLLFVINICLFIFNIYYLEYSIAHTKLISKPKIIVFVMEVKLNFVNFSILSILVYSSFSAMLILLVFITKILEENAAKSTHTRKYEVNIILSA